MSLESSSLQEFLTARKLDATVTRNEFKDPLHKFWIKPGPKCDIKKVENAAVDLGLALMVSPPLVAPDFETGTIRLEFMTAKHPLVDFEQLAESSGFADFENLRGKYELPVLLGTTDVDQPLIVDLASFPHLLLAGTTGAGKSVSEHCIIQSLMMHARKNRVKIVLMDPKFVEFHGYENSSALWYDKPGVATSAEIIEERLADLTAEMDKRLKILQKHGCRNLKEFRAKHPKHGTYLVVVIDELADLMRTTKKRFEKALDRLAAKARAAGIHIVAATQYPKADVITSTIKANFDGRVCFRVSEAVHSRVMLENNGAEKLMGCGDGFISGDNYNMQRFQGALVNLAKDEPSAVSKFKSLFAGKID